MKTAWILSLLCLAAPFVLAEEAAVTPLPLTGFSDEGTFKLFKNETQIGAITYSLTPDGGYTRKFTLSLAGQTVEFDIKIGLDTAGLWNTMDITAPTDTVTVKRVGGKAEYTSKAQNVTASVALTNNHILYESYGPVFESFVVKAYDKEKKGKQTFSRYLIPAVMMDCDLEYKSDETRPVNGVDKTFHVYDFVIAGIHIALWTDDSARVYLMDVPVQYAAFVREGYEDLLKPQKKAAGVSQPEFGFRKETVMVPMRDGVKLATELYIPEGAGAKWPTVLVRTPYKKEMEQLKGDFWAKRGYVTAIQDCRGRFGSEGLWEPFVNDRKDGYDTIEWIAGQAWSTGKVGMIGASYSGWVQLWAAAEKPPHLTTIIPNVAPPDPFFNIPYEYGSFFILGCAWWAEVVESEATGDLSGKALSKISERKYEEILKKLPVIELDKDIFGKENRSWRKWIEHNTNDDYWARANFLDELSGVTIPVFLQSGWFDGDGIGSKLNYAALKKGGNEKVKLVLGPWGHTDQSMSRLGDYDFGEEAALDLQTLYLRWFDHYLKDMDNGIESEPWVQIFTMFSNKWLSGKTYPLPETTFTNFYLTSRKGANTSKGDGRLGSEPPAGKKTFDAYAYDPGNPTPWPEYNYKSAKELEEEKKGVVDTEKRRARAKAFHKSVTDTRKDILVYETEPLALPMTIAGPLTAVLYASTSAVDTDWFVTLMDVDEKGEILPLAHGTIRARFRESTHKPVLLEKDKVYEYTIDMWQTGITFEKGHKIRVEVASAMFPAFSRNLNTGGHNETEKRFVTANQRIFHSKEYPSRIVLPVVALPAVPEAPPETPPVSPATK